MTEKVLLQLILIIPPLLSPFIAVGGVLLTIWFNNRRERARMEHERTLRLRDERIGAYRRLLAATTTAHTEREAVDALGSAYAEITLLAGSPQLSEAAENVWQRYREAHRTADKSKKDRASYPPGAYGKTFLDRAQDAKEEFLELARKELGVDPGAAAP